MEFSTATLFGQAIGLVALAAIIYLVIMVPLSLRKIAGQLAGIKDELRAQRNESSLDSRR
jgi:hypothetical protein